MKLFVDTSAFVALADRADQFHDRAKRFAEGLSRATRFQTSSYIVDETVTRLRATAGVKVAVRAAEALWTSELYRIHAVDHALEREALATMRKYDEHRLSFTDCTTLVLMEHLGIERVFAFDEDFHKVGYVLVPEADR